MESTKLYAKSLTARGSFWLVARYRKAHLASYYTDVLQCHQSLPWKEAAWSLVAGHPVQGRVGHRRRDGR